MLYNFTHEAKIISPSRILTVCTEQMRQTKSVCVALPNCPRCQKLGETIFVSACGIQTIEANAVTADVRITLAVRSLPPGDHLIYARSRNVGSLSKRNCNEVDPCEAHARSLCFSSGNAR